MHPKHLKIADFTYQLPEEKIAAYPLGKRDDSKLLIYKDKTISETGFAQLAEYVPAGSLMVFNNSKVIEARLLFKKESGGIIEIFMLEPYKMDVSTAMQTQSNIECLCLVGGLSKWKNGLLTLRVNNVEGADNQSIILTADFIERIGDACRIRFNWISEHKTFADILHVLGQIPIPPYLNRVADETDKERYQTIYAKADGSVAAPTAGLHFTPTVLSNLKEKNITTAYATLHVGAGTFRPVKSETIEGHEMHAEYIDVSVDFIQQLITHEKIIPVGTTSLRTIESIYWMGLKAFLDPSISGAALEITQWEMYDGLMQHAISKKDALESLIKWMKINKLERLIIPTQILIAPSYQVKVATGIVTNFHQPNSTLLLLIAALVGNDWKNIYGYALQNAFRFLSYGDSSYLEINV